MSPARLSIEDMTESELSFTGDLWSALPNKKQKMQHKQKAVDLADDLETLWETKWKSACQRQRAPFQDASHLDVAPLITSLLQSGTTSVHSPVFTQAFLTAAADLAANPAATPTRLLNACALLRIARYQSPSAPACPLKQGAYAMQKQLHARAARMWDTDSPLDEVLIAHTRAPLPDFVDRDYRRPQIPALVRVPLATLLEGRACPAVVVVSNSDRFGCTDVCESVLERGWAVVVVECSAAAGDDEAAVCESVLGWMAAMGFYEMENVVVLAEGEAGLRVAGEVGEKLLGVVAYLDREVSSVDDEALFETQPLCPSLVVSERQSSVETNGQWTPVEDDENEDSLDVLSDLYAFGKENMACISRLRSTGESQVLAWVGDLMAGRQGGYFWTMVLKPGKMAGLMLGRFERESTPPSLLEEGIELPVY